MVRKGNKFRKIHIKTTMKLNISNGNRRKHGGQGIYESHTKEIFCPHSDYVRK
jgi:hypothetical protein